MPHHHELGYFNGRNSATAGVLPIHHHPDRKMGACREVEYLRVIDYDIGGIGGIRKVEKDSTRTTRATRLAGKFFSIDAGDNAFILEPAWGFLCAGK